jgi:ribonuclease BN (tRNA processing enzyme)
MKIKLLGAHNTESLRTRHTCLLIDDILAIDAGALTSHLSARGMSLLKAVLLTHSHYDHIRDIPALGINLFLRRLSADIYSHEAVLNNLTTHFLNNVIYPEYHKRPADRPTLRLHLLEDLKLADIEGYRILPVKVNHAIPTFGYQVTSAEGKSVFYTGDTGGGLAETWKQISPDVLLIDLTASNRWEENIKKNGHLTPDTLRKELVLFRELKAYLPRVIAVHLNPAGEKEIKAELEKVDSDLGIHILVGRQNMQIQV